MISSACFAAAITVSAAQAQTVSIKGTTFDHWFLTSWATLGGAASFSIIPQGDTPQHGLECTTFTQNAPNEQGMCIAIFDPVTVKTPIAGDSYTVSLKFLSGRGAYNEGQGLYVVFLQQGNVYILPLGDTFVKRRWTGASFTGSLDATNYLKLTPGGFVSAAPDLSSGIPTKIGFAAVNYASAPISTYYDDVAITIQ
jgi:hypothetical protein